jgi:hypothetical protein
MLTGRERREAVERVVVRDRRVVDRRSCARGRNFGLRCHGRSRDVPSNESDTTVTLNTMDFCDQQHGRRWRLDMPAHLAGRSAGACVPLLTLMTPASG